MLCFYVLFLFSPFFGGCVLWNVLVLFWVFYEFFFLRVVIWQRNNCSDLPVMDTALLAMSEGSEYKSSSTGHSSSSEAPDLYMFGNIQTFRVL